MEELAALRARPQLDGASSSALPHGRLYIIFGPVITTEAHLEFAGAMLHSNNTAELLEYRWVARDSQACIFFESWHAASICLGTVQSQANVPLRLACQRLLLQTQLRLRFAVQHICSHAQNLGNECADHAVALGTNGLVSNQNIRIRWAHSSFGSTSFCAM